MRSALHNIVNPKPTLVRDILASSLDKGRSRSHKATNRLWKVIPLMCLIIYSCKNASENTVEIRYPTQPPEHSFTVINKLRYVKKGVDEDGYPVYETNVFRGIATKNNEIIFSPESTLSLLYYPECDAYIVYTTKGLYLLDKKGNKQRISDQVSAIPLECRESLLSLSCNKKYGVFDIAKGRMVKECTYGSVFLLPNGFYAVKEDKKLRIYNNSSNVDKAIGAYDEFSSIYENVLVVKDGEKYGYLFLQDMQTISPSYEDALPFSEGLAAVKIDKKWGWINKEGKVIINPSFEWADMFHEGVARVKQEGSYGLINKNGKFVLPAEYQAIGISRYGLVPLKKGGLWGLYDLREKKMLLNFEYDEILPTLNPNIIPVKKDNKVGFFDRKGNSLLGFNYDHASIVTEEGYVAVKMKDRWMIMNEKGTPVFESNDYNLVYPFSPFGYAMLKKQNNLWDVLDKNGKILLRDVHFDSTQVTLESRHYLCFANNLTILQNRLFFSQWDWLHPIAYNQSLMPFFIDMFFASSPIYTNLPVIRIKHENREILAHSSLGGEAKLESEKPPSDINSASTPVPPSAFVGVWSGTLSYVNYGPRGVQRGTRKVELSIIPSPYKSSDLIVGYKNVPMHAHVRGRAFIVDPSAKIHFAKAMMFFSLLAGQAGGIDEFHIEGRMRADGTLRLIWKTGMQMGGRTSRTEENGILTRVSKSNPYQKLFEPEVRYGR